MIHKSIKIDSRVIQILLVRLYLNLTYAIPQLMSNFDQLPPNFAQILLGIPDGSLKYYNRSHEGNSYYT